MPQLLTETDPKLESILDDFEAYLEDTHDLRLSAGQRDEGLEFLQRQLDFHDNYDLEMKRKGTGGNGFSKTNYFHNILIDKLIVLHYMTGAIPFFDPHDVKRRIGRHENGRLKAKDQRKEDLGYLSTKFVGTSSPEGYHYDKVDPEMRQAFSRHNKRRYIPHIMPYENWRSIIDELGSDPIVMEHFGEEINYKRHVSQSTYNDHRKGLVAESYHVWLHGPRASL